MTVQCPHDADARKHRWTSQLDDQEMVDYPAFEHEFNLQRFPHKPLPWTLHLQPNPVQHKLVVDSQECAAPLIAGSAIIPLSSHLSHFILVVLKEIAANACLLSEVS
jgi:hypothetical protein